MRVYIRQTPTRAASQWFSILLGAVKPESESATCPDCESTAVAERTRRDPSGRFAFIAWSAIQRVRGGWLYQCEFCGVQFYDTRTPRSGRP